MKDCGKPVVLQVNGSNRNVPPMPMPGWGVRACCAGDVAEAIRTAVPDLVLIDGAGAMAVAAIAAIRDGPAIAGSTPIVQLTTSTAARTGLGAAGPDGVIAATNGASAAQGLADWRPLDTAAMDQVAATFGAAAIAPMVRRLRNELVDALDRLAGVAVCGSDAAHRIAGIAGMLGFAATGAVWRRVFEGDESARADARRLTRLTIAAIDRCALLKADP